MKSFHRYAVELPYDGPVKTYETEQCHIMHGPRFETLEEACIVAIRGQCAYYVFPTEKELADFSNSYIGPKAAEVKNSIDSFFSQKKERQEASPIA